jgi:serine/threonine protein kinase
MRLGRYAIESEIGRGGMGVVYRALDEKLGKTVAVKMLSDPGTLTAESLGRLRQEARSAAILNHPSIVAVYDYEEAEGHPFIVYEYVEGQTLDRMITSGPLAEEKIIDIGIQVASGLAYAHDRGILHRDIKPQNIIVGADGRVRILDFGLAKRMQLHLVGPDGVSVGGHDSVATLAGTIVGTIQYMSPEQVAGETLDGRTDVFSLGAVLFELATGSNPFLGKSLTSTVGRIMSPDPPAMEGKAVVSGGLQEVIRNALQKKRENRYQSALLLRDALERAKVPAPQMPAPQKRESSDAAPVIPRPLARVSLILLQVLYLALYALALIKHMDVVVRLAHLSGDFIGKLEWARLAATGLLITGCCGIPVRLFLMVSVWFDDPETGRQFRRLFPFLFLLDELWALTPFLLIGKWPAGVTLICVALLAYLPISHRNLIRNAYVETGH